MENIAKSTSYGCYLDCDFETAKYPDDKTHIVGLLAEYVYDLEQRILHYDERYIKLWNEIETLRERVSKEFDQEQQIADLEEKIKALQNGIIDDETLNMLVKEHKLYKDLEAKLAESEKKAYSRGHSQRDIANEIKLNALREDVANKEKRIVELKQQLAESETKRKSLEEKVKFITEEKEENFVDGQKYNELKEQLVESEKSKESYRLQNEQHHLQLLQFYSRLGVEAFGADIHEKALETLMIMKEQLAEKEKEIEKLNACVDFYKSYSVSFQEKIIDELERVKEFCNNPKNRVEYEYCPNAWTYAVDKDKLMLEIDNQIKELKGEKK